MNPKVDEYLESKAQDWQRPILAGLRKCILDCGLSEEVKWGAPVYVHHGNVVGLGAFKNHIALWFFEGGTLKDASAISPTTYPMQNKKRPNCADWKK